MLFFDANNFDLRQPSPAWNHRFQKLKHWLRASSDMQGYFGVLRVFFIEDWHTANQAYVPQTLPVLQEVDELAPNENELPPFTFDANVDIFFFTCSLPQAGQTTSSILLRLKTSSSKDWPHLLQANSKIGMFHSWDEFPVA